VDSRVRESVFEECCVRGLVACRGDRLWSRLLVGGVPGGGLVQQVFSHGCSRMNTDGAVVIWGGTDRAD
jgi:hypothetical protein